MTREKFIEDVAEMATKMGVEYRNEGEVIQVGCLTVYCFEKNMALWGKAGEIGIYYSNINSMYANKDRINFCVDNLAYFGIAVKEA